MSSGLKEAAGISPIEMIRAAQSGNAAGLMQVINEALKASSKCETCTWPVVLRRPASEGDLSIAIFPLGLDDEMRVLVAGSRRVGFPDATEQLLLNAAANQAAIGLREAGLLREHRRLAEERDFYLAEEQRLAHTGSWSFNPSGFLTIGLKNCFRSTAFIPRVKPQSRLRNRRGL